MIKTLSLSLVFIHLSAVAAEAVRCKDYSNCRQAVINWCSGKHNRADGDGDGIPCENVCRSLSKVNQIRRSIGC